MTKRHRYKVMSADELHIVQERNWMPVTLAGAAIPTWMRGIPQERLLQVMGSGTYWDMQMAKLGNNVIENVVAGYDVFRYDPHDESLGYPVNKDHYVVFKDSGNDEMYFVAGPMKDDDHWLSELPKIRSTIEITELPSEGELDDDA